MRALIFGGTGMVGSGVLMEALEHEEVTSVVTIGRRATGRSHPRLEEIVHDDFFDYTPVRDRLGEFEACFFCLGVSAAGMTEEEYHRLTYDLTLAAAETLVELNPRMTFCYLSGSGADSSESGRWMWARVRGKIENKLIGMPFKGTYVFRPAFIQPMKGVRSRTRLYAFFYGLLGPLHPLLRRAFPRYVTDSVTVGRAMVRVAGEGHPEAILENWDINALGGEGA
jgi:uncharacterized protein YbjT (DUF2867 family)